MSKLLDGFNQYVAQQGLDEALVFTEDGDGFTLVSFPEDGAEGETYNVVLVLYENDDDAEVYVRKALGDYDRSGVLERANELNAKYSCNVFLVDDDMLTVKTHLFANGEIMAVLRDMVTEVQIAKIEFPTFAGI